MKICLVVAIIFSLFPPAINVFGDDENNNGPNILLINSYHRGYEWTDSINAGILSKLRSYPEASLYSVDMDTKKFDNTKLEADKKIHR